MSHVYMPSTPQSSTQARRRLWTTRVALLVSAVLMATACKLSPAGSKTAGQLGNSLNNSTSNSTSTTAGFGTVNLAMTSVSQLMSASPLTSAAAFRVQSTGPNVHLGNMTPDGFQVKFNYIDLETPAEVAGVMGNPMPGPAASSSSSASGSPSPTGPGSQFGIPLYQGTAPVDLSNPSAVAAEINQNALQVPAGTYSAISFQIDTNSLSLEGSASVNGTTIYTRAASTSDPTVEPTTPEFAPLSLNGLTLQSSGATLLVFAQPLVVKPGQNVTVSLVYNLADTALATLNGNNQIQYGDGYGFAVQNLPITAMVGTPLTPEIYDVYVPSPQAWLGRTDSNAFPSDNFHFVYSLFQSGGKFEGGTSTSAIDSGYDADIAADIAANDGPGVVAPPVHFGDDVRDSSTNADGTFHLTTGKVGDDPYAMFDVPSFAPLASVGATGSATVNVWRIPVMPETQATPSAPAAVTFTYTRVQ